MSNALDLVGCRFGKLEVISLIGTIKQRRMWLCKCDCGNTIECSTGTLRGGGRTNCGCSKGSAFITHGKSGSRLYGVWAAMKDRCKNPNNKRFEHYGGRGIKVCEEWLDFSNFYNWAISTGYDENAEYGKMTLDRIDTDGDYEPDNCRWADLATQANNHRNMKKYEAFGESHTLGEWAAIKGINYQTLSSRIHRDKMPIEYALEK